MKMIVKKDDISKIEKNLLLIINNINNEINSIEKLKKDLVWLGLSYETFIENFDELIKEERQEMMKLETFTKFLDEVLLNYSIAIEDIEKEFQKNIDETDEMLVL